MRVVSLVEQLFFLIEKHKQPMHVGGLFLFDIPTSAKPDFVTDLVRQIRNGETPPTFPFNQVLHNLTFWKTTEHFDLHYHFHHTVLSKPHSFQALLSYVSDVHANMLDKNYPLWECHIIEGIDNVPTISETEPKRFALYFKIHHSLVDGVAAMRIVEKSLSNSSTEVMTLPPWALLSRDEKNLKNIAPSKRTFSGIVKEQIGTIKPVFGELKNELKERKEPGFVSTIQAPTSPLNQRISNSRAFFATTYALSRFQKIAEVLQVSLNDVALAICSGALRSYLLQLEQLPEEPLIAFVPVSLRKDDSASGNQASLVLCNLATNVDDPIERIKAIHASMTMGKDKFGRMEQAQVINYSAISYAWEGVNLLTNAYPKKQAFNILISNVPGPKEPLYWNGATLSALYPASVVFNGQALNITFSSYLDKLHFGIVGCDKTLPNLEYLTEALDTELLKLEMICNLA
ncbi:WS/DGAT/MGAT family O-acyltransferase [Psychrobacter piechaudii]|uniref:diacylglycerol O-acyltransferase n=1 Tax=Psychrobacter piechaudii TaxID=1945521 RepID=A0A1R4GK38_9GAMM|nr:wax ester/triacylglycerol synthase family O-acyltransferase [Psychrobacter piechaudii]SJM68455.1 O-acyltransferase WSD [Psychrobacter piechaudii]